MTDRYDMFKIDSFEKYELLDFSETDDIKTFNKKFWKADSIDNDFSFVVKFDFKKGNFSYVSDNGIKIEGFPFHCLEIHCNRNNLKLYISDNYQITNFENEVLSEVQIKDLLKSNILNYGKDPSLSENPKEAIVELYLKSYHKISKIGHVLRVITDTYIEIIESKQNETSFANNQMADKFPLNIHLRELMTPPNEFMILNEEDLREIIDDISIDTLTLYGKKGQHATTCNCNAELICDMNVKCLFLSCPFVGIVR